MRTENERRANAPKGYFVLDGSYFRQQAREAFWTFVAPFTGIYSATGRRNARYVSLRRRNGQTPSPTKVAEKP